MSFEYLSDEELNNLISDVEQNDMVTAPPDILGSILEQIDVIPECVEEVEKITHITDRKEEAVSDKIIEYKKYRFRVIAAISGVVAAVMIVPEITNIIPKSQFADKKIVLEDQGWSEAISSSHYISDFINNR